MCKQKEVMNINMHNDCTCFLTSHTPEHGPSTMYIVCSPGPSGSGFIDEIFYRCDNNRWPCVLECLVFDVPVNMKCVATCCPTPCHPDGLRVVSLDLALVPRVGAALNGSLV